MLKNNAAPYCELGIYLRQAEFNRIKNLLSPTLTHSPQQLVHVDLFTKQVNVKYRTNN